MEVQSSVSSGHDAAGLQNRIAVLEVEIARERQARQAAEQARDQACRVVVALRAELAGPRQCAAESVTVPRDVAVPISEPKPAEPVVAAVVAPVAPAALPVAGQQDGITLVAPIAAVDPARVVAPVAQDAPSPTVEAEGADKRRDRRMPAKLAATFWHTSMPSAAHCTIADRSGGGARIECKPDPYQNQMSNLKIGDQITLSFENALERTSVVCVVMWATGNRCGVRFVGQFHNTMKTPRKPIRQTPVASKTRSRRLW